MKYLFSLLFSSFLLFITIHYTHAQSVKLEGFIGMEGGELYTYDVTAQPTDIPNEYTGVAKTHVFKGQEFRVAVWFKVNPADNSIDFKETQILDETGFSKNVTVCLVQALLNYDEATGILKGDINTSTTNNGAYCAVGKLTFMNKNGLDPLFNPVKTVPTTAPTVVAAPPTKAPKPTPKTPTKNTVVVNATPAPIVVRRSEDPAKPKQVTEGKAVTIQWESETITLEIYDDNTVDHDIVSIFYNNKEILSNYKLLKEPKRMTFQIGGSELNIITIKAMNNGGEPPNTAMIHLYDGEKLHKVLAHNDAGRSAIINIIKEIK